MTIYSRNIATDTANAKVNPSDLRSEISDDAWTPNFIGLRVKGDYQADGTLVDNPTSGKLDIEFDAALPAGEITQLDDLLAAHAGNARVITQFIALIKILEGERSVTEEAWTEIGGVVTDIEGLVGNISDAVVILTGLWKTSGTGAGLRIVGDNTLGAFEAPDTSSVMTVFREQTYTAPLGGNKLFKVEARLNGATSFDVKYITLSLYKIRTLGA